MKCTICGNNAGLTASRTNCGDWLCSKCLKAAGGLSKWPEIKRMPASEIQKRIHSIELVSLSEASDDSGTFNPTIVLGKNLVLIDEQNKLVQFPQVTLENELKRTLSLQPKEPKRIYRFDEIMGCDLIENNEAVTKGSLGGAVAGALAFGETGAVLGSMLGKKKMSGICESLRVKVSVKDFKDPAIFIDVINSRISKSSFKYKEAVETAEKIVSAIELMRTMD